MGDFLAGDLSAMGLAGVNLAVLAGTVLVLKVKSVRFEKDLEELREEVKSLGKRIDANRESLIRFEEREKARERRLNGRGNGP